jgi:predicted CoA-binding protein
MRGAPAGRTIGAEVDAVTTIDDFFTGKRYALVEIDPAAGGYGRAVFDRLLQAGREPVLVLAAPAAGIRDVVPAVYASVADVPGPLDGVVLNVEGDPDRVLHEVRAAAAKRVPRIWIENRCAGGEAVAFALAHGMEVVDGACSLLALDHHHIHWLHRKALDALGRTPRVQRAVAA